MMYKEIMDKFLEDTNRDDLINIFVDILFRLWIWTYRRQCWTEVL